MDHADALRAQPRGERRGIALERRRIERQEFARTRRLDHVGRLAGVPDQMARWRRAGEVAHMPVHAAAEKRGDVQDCARAHFLDGTVKPASSAPTMALLAGAATWGVLWYPYRLLAGAGLDGVWSTIITYGVTLVLGVAIFPRAVLALARAPALAL